MDVFKLAAARPSGILALLFFHRNVATSGPNILVMVNISSMMLFANIWLGFSLHKLFSSLSSLSGAVFACCFPSRVFLVFGNSCKYVRDCDQLYPIPFSSPWRSSRVVTVCNSSLCLLSSVAEDVLAIFTIVERISGWSNSICGLSVSVWLNNLSVSAA